MNKGFQKSWTLILITMCILFIFGLLGFIPFFGRHEYLFMSLGELALLLPIALGAAELKNNSLEKSLKKGFAPSLIPIFILIPFCMQTFVVYMTLPIHSILYEIFGEMTDTVGRADSLPEFLAQVVSVCILPAFIEELLCRGVVMDMMKPYGIAAAMLVSAFSFTLLHFSAYSFLVIFMLGMLMAAVRILTGSLIACMLIHFSNNFFSLIMNGIPEENTVALGIITAISFILFPVLIMRLMKKTGGNVAGMTDIKTQKITFSPAMCICLAIFAATAIFEMIA